MYIEKMGISNLQPAILDYQNGRVPLPETNIAKLTFFSGYLSFREFF